MNNSTSPLTFEDKISAATKAQIPLPSQEFQRSLGERLLNQTISKPKWYQTLNLRSLSPTKALVYIVVVLTFLTVLIVGPKNIYAAIQNLLRYIPGIGFVEPNRELTEPVTVERDGISLTVQSMVVTEEETALLYFVQNYPARELFVYCENQKALDLSFECLRSDPFFQLRTGDNNIILGSTTGGYSSENKQGLAYWSGRVVFSSLPQDVYEVDLLLDVLPNMYLGMAPEDWVIPLILKDADVSNQASIVFQPDLIAEIPEVAETQQNVSDTETKFLTDLRDKVHMTLDTVAVQDGYIALKVNIEWENKEWNVLDVRGFSKQMGNTPIDPTPNFAVLTDETGKRIPLEVSELEGLYHDVSDHKTSFVFEGEIDERDLDNTFTLQLNNVNVSSSLNEYEISTFLFDPEVDLQQGECVEISQSISVHSSEINFIKVCSVEPFNWGGGSEPGITPPPTPLYGLELYATLPSWIDNILTEDVNCLEERGLGENCGNMYSGGIIGGQDIWIINGQYYNYRMPTWPVKFQVSRYNFILPGPWIFQFEIPGLEP